MKATTVVFLLAIVVDGCSRHPRTGVKPDTSHPQLVCTSPDAGGDIPDSLRVRLRYPPDTDSRENTVRWTKLSRDLPGGWAGFEVWPDRVVFGFVDPVAGQASVPAIRRELAKENPGYIWNNIAIHQTRWSYAQLQDWEHFAVQTLQENRIAGLTGWVILVPKNIIQMDFVDRAAQANAIRFFKASPIPCDLILTKVSGPIYLY